MPAMLSMRVVSRPGSAGVVARLYCCLVLFVVLASRCTMVVANIMGDDCNWTGSGLSSPDGPERGVTPVYLRCSQGRLRWSYPRGALRVLLRAGGSGAEFRGCLRLHDNFKGARVFLEGPRSLVPLFAHDDGAPAQLVRCFHSRGGQAALYVEAVRTRGGGDFTKEVASFTYDLETLPRGGKAYDPAEECRPCTKEEMAHAFCTSDLVTRGIIRSIENKDLLEMTQVTVKVTKLLRHSTEDGLCGEQGCESNLLDSSKAERVGEVVVQVPQHCGARHGLGEFVFMARRKLGELALQCAPRLEDWASLVRSITQDGTAHCILAS
ncbi:meteorin-like protein [Anabrus simplex]|uniref:meteorin-like protein n=1 Tax=Anabrus simplex TaxID=316456 RepID=UPI0035A38A88